MAMKVKNLERVKLSAEGDKVEGYLLTVGTQEYKDKKDPLKVNTVPKLTMQRKDGGRFTIALGAGVNDDVGELEALLFTAVTFKGQANTSGGNRVNLYELAQDEEDRLDPLAD